MIAVTFLITLYLWQTWKVIDLRRKAEKLEEEMAPLVEKNRNLRVKVIRAFSLERIERVAKEKLGMKRPEPGSEDREE